MALASIPPHRQDLAKAVDWLISEVQREGVEVRLNRTATVESVLEEKPDAVIVATGAFPVVPNSFSGRNIVTAWEVLAGKETEREVLILGGGMVGIETAEYLYKKGCRVTVVEMLNELAIDMEGTTRALALKRLEESTISVLTSTKAEKVQNGRVLVSKDAEGQWLEAGTIVLALGSRPNQELAKSLEDRVAEIYAVGDCVTPRKAKEAIHEGFEAALRIN
jgi:pyruvate/2-oxoglutarate dehydrogenase complex dihydrolipoamide dehydrogenase (E3) component